MGSYTGLGMLPLLLHQMHARLAAGPIVTPSNVVALYNDVETERDYNAGLQSDSSQCAHAVSTAAALLVDGVRWDCISTDGYQAGCSTKVAANFRRLASVSRTPLELLSICSPAKPVPGAVWVRTLYPPLK